MILASGLLAVPYFAERLKRLQPKNAKHNGHRAADEEVPFVERRRAYAEAGNWIDRPGEDAVLIRLEQSCHGHVTTNRHQTFRRGVARIRKGQVPFGWDPHWKLCI